MPKFGISQWSAAAAARRLGAALLSARAPIALALVGGAAFLLMSSGAWTAGEGGKTQPASTQTASAPAAGPVTAGPVSAGPVTAGPVTAGPVAAGPVAGAPAARPVTVTSAPGAAGPVTPGPVTPGPVTAGPRPSAPPGSAGAATAARPDRPAPAGAAEAYRLDQGDKVRVRFFERFDRDDLNGDYIITELGELRLPRIGVFDVRGKSVAEVERSIREAVERRGEKLGFFAIDVSERRPFYVAGFAAKPGPYPYVPGLTVIHAVSIAGGIYRSPTTSIQDVIRERSRVTELQEKLKEMIARKARLETEREGIESIPVPPELMQLDPARAAEIIEREQALLNRQREVELRDRKGLEAVIVLTRTEADTFQGEVQAISRRIEEQSKMVENLRRLHDQKVINQQRFTDSAISLDSAQRDKQLAIAGRARAMASLERAERDLSMLKLARNAQLAKELADTDLELGRVRTILGQTRLFAAVLESQAGGGESAQAVSYRILRRNAAGELALMEASERTAVLPGDVVQVLSPTEGGGSLIR